MFISKTWHKKYDEILNYHWDCVRWDSFLASSQYCCDNDDCSSWRMGNQAEFEFLRENSCCSIFPRLLPSLHYHRNHQEHHNNSDPQPERRLSGGVEPQPSAENLGRDQPANKHGEDCVMMVMVASGHRGGHRGGDAGEDSLVVIR